MITQALHMFYSSGLPAFANQRMLVSMEAPMSKTKISDGNGPYSGEKNPDPSGTRTEVGHAGMGVPVGGGGPVGALDWRDVVCSIVWVGMLTVTFWRGTWNVLALYVFPRSNIVHAVVCYAVGSVTRTVLSVAAPSLHAYVTGATLARQVSVTSPHADVTGAPGARRVSVPSPHAYVTGATLARQVSVTSPHADVTGVPGARRVSVPSPHAYVTGATLARQVSVTSPHADVTGAPGARRMSVPSPHAYVTGATLARQVSVTSPHADVTGAPRARRVSVTSPHADVTGATRARRMAVTSLYNYAFCVATVAHWRGVWKLLDTFVPLSWTWSLVSAFVGFVGLALLRSSRMAVPPPMAVGIDTRDDYFVPLPRFRSTVKMLYTVAVYALTPLLFRLQWRSTRSYYCCSVYRGGIRTHAALVPVTVEVYALILLLFRLPCRSTRSRCSCSVYSGGLRTHTTVVPFTV